MPDLETEIPSNIIEILKQQLVDIKKATGDLQSIKSGLQVELKKLDTEILPKQVKSWEELRNKHINKLIAELESQNIVLTEEEKNELSRGGLTATDIKEQTKNLENNKIKLPKNPSGFTINAYTIILDALRRTLQTKDPNITIKKLKTIDNANKDFDKEKKSYQQEHNEIIQKIKESKKKATETSGLTDDQLNLLKQVQKVRPTVAPEITPEEARKLAQTTSK